MKTSGNLRRHLLRGMLRLLFNRKRSIAELRAFSNKAASLTGRIPRGMRVEGVDIDGIRAEWLSTSAALDDQVVLYLHGGGYISGSIITHRMLCILLAQCMGLHILLPEYRLAPEHPFPAALEDATTIYHWLLAKGFKAKNIIIAGDSAGGGLSLATVLSLRDASDPLPAGVVCLSSWADLTLSGDTHRTNARSEPVLTFDGLSEWAQAYTDKSNYRNPLVSPIYAKFHGFPPLLIQVGSDEVLLDDSLSLAEKARADGVDVSLRIWDGMWHVWHASGPFLPESRDAFDEIRQFVHKQIGA